MSFNLTIINQMFLPWMTYGIAFIDALISSVTDTLLWMVVDLPSSNYFLWFKTIACEFVSISPALAAIGAIIAIYYAYIKEGRIYVGFLTYCICDKQNINSFDIELPLGFYNTGATGKTVIGLRIRIKRGDWISNPLYCEHTLNDLGIGANGDSKDINRKWATPFIIEPRRGYANCFSFSIKKKIEDIKLTKGNYKIILEAKFANKKGWGKIDIIDFYIEDENFNCVTVHPNDPEFFKFSHKNEEGE